jgi:heptosyltransferase-2
LARAVTGQTVKINFPKIYLSPKEIEDGQHLLQKYISGDKKVVMISILGSSKSKSLPPAVIAEMLDFIASNTDFTLLFNYLPSQATEARIIFDLSKPETRQKVIFNLYADRLREFMTILVHCRALIGNEGGAVNIAKALDIPTFSVFCPWIPKTLWDMLVDEDKHIAIHVQDYFPELYPENHSLRTVKKNYELYYKKLSFDLFKNSLMTFLKRMEKGNNSAE